MPTDTAAAERARAELAEIRATRAERAAARVRTAVELGADAATAERQRRAVVACLPPDPAGYRLDVEEAAHQASEHAPDTRPHACPLCAEDTGDPFGIFEARTIAETVERLQRLHRDQAAARALAEAEEAATMEPGGRGRCDTCGARVDPVAGECSAVASHAVAVDVLDPLQLRAHTFRVTWSAAAVTAGPVTTPLVVLAETLDAETAAAILAGILQVDRDAVTVDQVEDDGPAPL